MITVPTTLVLGAGASKPYGFPSGIELRRTLCDTNFLYGMRSLGFILEELEAFRNTFLKSELRSIDAFLARRGEDKVNQNSPRTYSEIGKAAIAYCLIRRESPEDMHVFTNDNWYQYLWSFMADSLDAFGKNKLRIITFNYDRSLEYYLLTALQHSFGITAHDAAHYLKKIPILHVYGQLAMLPELSQIGQESRHFRPDVDDSAYIAAAARGIRVIEESREDDEVFAQAYSYLKEAQRVCFLGFGFDSTNVRRLRLDDLTKCIRDNKQSNVRFFATTLGLEASERNSVIQKLDARKTPLHTDNSQLNIESYGDFKAEKYLRATGVFLS